MRADTDVSRSAATRFTFFSKVLGKLSVMFWFSATKKV